MFNSKGHSLYLCYFGLRESLVQTQVLPYLRQIRESGVKISLLTFETNPEENWTKEQIELEREYLASQGINWYFLTYHKSPSVPATIYDVLCGVAFARKLVKKENIDVLHARSHVPALMGALAKKLSRKKPELLFDIRGFFPEEYTDAGRWKENGWLYHTVKKIEKWLLKTSDGFVVLTERARDILFAESKGTGFDKLGRPIEVIPCCVDLKRFESVNDDLRENKRRELNLKDRFVVAYVGSFGGWYLTKETVDFLKTAKEMRPNTFALILTQSDSKMIQSLLEERGFGENDFLITKVLPSEIPSYLAAADIALSFIKQCYSKQASSATKNAEYFACGIPVIASTGTGDTDEMMREDKTGVLIEEFKPESYRDALLEIERLLAQPDLAERCRLTAAKRFDLIKVGGTRYNRLYKNLLNSNGKDTHKGVE
jgi:glycosyltransferase involved in cell wall biosynthesis